MNRGDTTLALEVATLSDVGRRRSHNEDHVAVLPGPADGPWAGGVLLLVADGMGGANAGEVASQMAIEIVTREVFARPAAEPDAALRQAIEAANEHIWQEASGNSEWSGMGTTCTALWVHDGSVWMAHVGDSRAYLVRDGVAHLLTQDHSLVAQLVQKGQLTAEQAKTDPRRNVVTRSVGASASVEVDAGSLDQALRPGDVLLVCSDGLHGLVGEDELAWYAAGESLEKVCEDLIALANDRGGHDNISLVVGRAVPAPARDEAGGLGKMIRKIFGGPN